MWAIYTQVIVGLSCISQSASLTQNGFADFFMRYQPRKLKAQIPTQRRVWYSTVEVFMYFFTVIYAAGKIILHQCSSLLTSLIFESLIYVILVELLHLPFEGLYQPSWTFRHLVRTTEHTPTLTDLFLLDISCVLVQHWNLQSWVIIFLHFAALARGKLPLFYLCNDLWRAECPILPGKARTQPAWSPWQGTTSEPARWVLVGANFKTATVSITYLLCTFSTFIFSVSSISHSFF